LGRLGFIWKGEGRELWFSRTATVHLRVNAYASNPPSSPPPFRTKYFVDKPFFSLESMALHVIIQKQKTKTNFPQRSSRRIWLSLFSWRALTNFFCLLRSWHEMPRGRGRRSRDWESCAAFEFF
jgi:hypothetical protein